jgi:hypothetical protein
MGFKLPAEVFFVGIFPAKVGSEKHQAKQQKSCRSSETATKKPFCGDIEGRLWEDFPRFLMLWGA